MSLIPALPVTAVGVAEALAHAAAGATVLDARAPEDFARGHLAGAGRMGVDEFHALRAELPPRTATVLVVHDEPAAAHRAAVALGGLGYPHTFWLDAPLDALPGGRDDAGPAARLWRPSPWLEAVCESLPAGRSLDLAAGSGRESVFLALRGFEAHAWDHDPTALERAHALAARHGATLRTRVVELERGPLPECPGAFDVVMVFRYLHRSLWPWIAASVAPGGAIVHETFLAAQARHGRPKQARFLLQPGELREAFPGFVVERYEETSPERSPVMARLLARRPRD
ncbi:MAG: methyltransferase domain-containing protein [Candidatus Eisenbacteria bacterium]|uniref:Methyltransferase domain-containing protein n=1 Tax=Eiseniibacteriota bacterium TaxID=2212470 RepID=A0A933SCX9_UNCEI|nr:methyltransferase domain-containing protein [Candidatus Eisenbacteria bacterium]